MYITTQTGDLWPRSRGSPWGVKILKDVKIFVMLFFKMVIPISIKFGMVEDVMA